MSSRNGDRSRFNRLRKQKIRRRAVSSAIRTSTKTSTAKLEAKRGRD